MNVIVAFYEGQPPLLPGHDRHGSFDLGQILTSVVSNEVGEEGGLSHLGRPHDGHDEGWGLHRGPIHEGHALLFCLMILSTTKFSLRTHHRVDCESFGVPTFGV